MLYLALSISGVAESLCPAVLHTYMGVMGTKMDEIRTEQQKKPRKFIVYIAYSLLLNGTSFVIYGKRLMQTQMCNIVVYHLVYNYYVILYISPS